MDYKQFYFIFILLCQSSFAQKQEFICGVNDKVLPDSIIKTMQMASLNLKEKQARKSANELYVCKIAIDIDSDTYKIFDKDTLYIKYEVIKMIDKISKLYENEINTRLVVTKINIWKDEKYDPYFGTLNIFTLLNILRETWEKPEFKKINFDKVIYLPTKQFVGAGGVALLGGKFNVSRFGFSNTIAHELGHNFGSPHTQNCSWPDGMLDYCTIPEGNCYTGQGELIRGTIMSYCNNKFSFHPICRELMNLHSQNNLQKINKDQLPIPKLDTLNNNSQNPYLFIEPVSTALMYSYQIAIDKDFKNIIVNDSTRYNAITFAFKKGIKYYVRLKAKNHHNTTEWSTITAYQLQDEAIETPTQLFPIHNFNGVKRNEQIELKFDKVTGAEKYEIGLYDITNGDYAFNTNFYVFPPANITLNNSFIIEKNKYYYDIGNDGFHWRVRAIIGEKKGPWSELKRVVYNDLSVNFTFNDTERLPENININLKTFNRYFSNVFRVSISDNNEFKNLIYQKNIIAPDYYIYELNVFSGILNVGKVYYYRIEEIDNNSSEIIRNINGQFNIPVVNNSLKVSYINSTINKNIGDNIYSMFLKGNSIWGRTEKGIYKLNVNDKSILSYTRANTNGIIGNRILSVGTDSLNQILVLFEESNGFGDILFLKTFDSETFKLTSSVSFPQNYQNPVYNVEPLHKVFVNNDKQLLQRIRGNKTEILLKLENNQSIVDFKTSKHFIWINISNTNGYNEILRLNILNKESKIISSVTTFMPKYYNSWLVDNDENLYISTFKELMKFDGEKWITFNFPKSFINQNGQIILNQFGNIYLKFNNSSTFFKLKNNEFIKDFDIPILNPQTNYVKGESYLFDKYGNVWFLNGVTNMAIFNICSTISTTNITSSSSNLVFGTTTTLEAKNCNNVVWNWKNKEENTYEKLILGTNKVDVSPKSNTTYFARCYDEGCSGEETAINLTVTPNLFVNKIEKIQVCQGDTLKIFPKIEGYFDDNNQMTAILTSQQSNFNLPLVNNNTNYALITNSDIPSGKYWLKLQGNLPKVVSKDSIEVSIEQIPLLKITGVNSFCEGQNTTLTAKVTAGISPYIFQWKNNTNIVGTNSANFSAGTEGEYTVNVTDSKGCLGTSTKFSVSQNPLPNLTIAKSQATDILQNTSVTLSVSPVSGQIFQWNKDGVAISGATNNSYTASLPGAYTVSATSNGCTTISEVVVVNLILSNEPNTLEKANLIVFPNPNDGYFTIEFNSSDINPIELVIIDMLGRTILRKSIKVVGKYIQQVNMSEQPSGQYLIMIQRENGAKIIKMSKK